MTETAKAILCIVAAVCFFAVVGLASGIGKQIGEPDPWFYGQSETPWTVCYDHDWVDGPALATSNVTILLGIEYCTKCRLIRLTAEGQ